MKKNAQKIKIQGDLIIFFDPRDKNKAKYGRFKKFLTIDEAVIFDSPLHTKAFQINTKKIRVLPQLLSCYFETSSFIDFDYLVENPFIKITKKYLGNVSLYLQQIITNHFLKVGKNKNNNKYKNKNNKIK